VQVVGDDDAVETTIVERPRLGLEIAFEDLDAGMLAKVDQARDVDVDGNHAVALLRQIARVSPTARG
jgi:hypothetical protein